MRGVTRMNKYTGYQSTSKFAGNFSEDVHTTGILFMDGVFILTLIQTSFNDHSSPRRRATTNGHGELAKALLAFTADTNGERIATGNWGCGAFGGAHTLNAAVQLMAAAAGAPLTISCHSSLCFAY